MNHPSPQLCYIIMPRYKGSVRVAANIQSHSITVLCTKSDLHHWFTGGYSSSLIPPATQTRHYL